MIQVKLHPKNNYLRDSEYSAKDEVRIFDEQLDDLIRNTKWYLENYETMKTYKVFWQDYSSKRATVPYKYVRRRKVKNTPKGL